jgi:hypothetical protein
MFYEKSFTLIGETLICLRLETVNTLGRVSWGQMGVFSLGEMKNENN